MDTIDTILDEVDELSYDNLELFVDVVNKRFNEIKRAKFIEETNKSLNQYKNGNISEGDSTSLFNEIGL